MITSHQEYKDAVNEYAANFYFWGFDAEYIDIYDLADLERTFEERLMEARRQLRELDMWVTRTQPISIQNTGVDKAQERTDRRREARIRLREDLNAELLNGFPKERVF